TGLETHNVLTEGVVAPSVSEGPGRAVREEQTLSRLPSTPVPRYARDDTTFTTPNAPPPVGPYPHAKRVGDMLFLSGIGPRRPQTGEIPGLIRDGAGSVIAHDIEVQTRATIENVRAILEEAGSSLEKVLDVTVYLTDMQRDFAAFNRIYGEYFGHVQPTRTTVGVESLPTPIAVELKVIAAAV
ncbi:MAG TPA: Rid family detoxifying hydrolase, partial [Thermoanaerobaculia bacterium]